MIPAAMSVKLTLNSCDIQSSGVLRNLHAWRTRVDLTETNERESPTLTLVCISPSSAICMKRNGSVVQRDWLTHKAVKTSPLRCWNSSNEHRREKKSENALVRSKERGLLFVLSWWQINGLSCEYHQSQILWLCNITYSINVLYFFQLPRCI